MEDTIQPFVSIVVGTYNRGMQLKECLESLVAQDYPRDRFEVIVVDDGSRDNTVEIARAVEGVIVIEHEKNKGISAARNTGLAAAKGEIVAYIDDDAVADRHWVEKLVAPFQSQNIAASGGQTFAYKNEFIAERYLSANGYGNPAPLAFGKSTNIFWRFLIYLQSMFKPMSIATVPTEVQAVYGLNCAFRASTLREVGGFDVTLKADEDSEISTRLRNQGAHIMFEPGAIIHHRHRESLVKLIRQTFHRAQYTVPYYAKEKKTLPIFPFPILYFVLLLTLLFIYMPAGIAFIILGPLALYCWWPIRGIMQLKPEYFLYSYIQLSLELAAILGIVRGLLQ